MIPLKNVFMNQLHFKCKKYNFYLYRKIILSFSNFVKPINKISIKKFNILQFSTSKNPDYVKYIEEINNYIDMFQKNSEENNSVSDDNIIPILEKIKNDTKYEENEDIIDIISSIKLLIEKRVRPIIVNDGGDIQFICFDIDDGTVYVHLQGACVTCSQSEMTLQYMIKNMLTYYISEIKTIKNVSNNGLII